MEVSIRTLIHIQLLVENVRLELLTLIQVREEIDCHRLESFKALAMDNAQCLSVSPLGVFLDHPIVFLRYLKYVLDEVSSNFAL